MISPEPKNKTILIVDDEMHIVQMLEMNMRTQGYKSIVAYSGEECLVVLEKQRPDLILLDIMLPGIDGIETCRRIKSENRTKTIPVIMLSAKSQQKDIIIGLEGGADDYITKPFSLQELFLRIQATLRQVEILKADSSRLYVIGDFQLDADHYSITIKNRKIEVTLTEFRILHLLCKHQNEMVSREDLITEVFEVDPASMGRAIDVHIRNIRKKLQDNACTNCQIETIRGSGYKITEYHET